MGMNDAFPPLRLTPKPDFAGISVRDERCELCRFCFETLPPSEAPKDLPTIYICRRYPPVLKMIMQPMAYPAGYIPKRGEQMQMVPANHVGQSQTQADGWCGEFKKNAT